MKSNIYYCLCFLRFIMDEGAEKLFEYFYDFYMDSAKKSVEENPVQFEYYSTAADDICNFKSVKL
jgi:hypothetical protein